MWGLILVSVALICAAALFLIFTEPKGAGATESTLADPLRAAMGEQLTPPGEFENARVLAGRLGEFELLVQGDEVHLAGPGVPLSVEFEPEQVHHAEMPDPDLGDPRFDPLVYMRGNYPELMARFDQDTRRLIGDFVASSKGSLLNGRLIAPITDRRPEALRTVVSTMHSIAQALAASSSRFEERLAENAAGDDNPDVRVNMLEALLDHFPRFDGRHAAIEAAWADSNARLRMVAAIHTLPEPERHARLTALADAQPTRTDESIALCGAARALGDPRYEAAVVALLESEDTAVVSAAVAALETLGGSPAIAALQARAQVEGAQAAVEHALAAIQARLGPAATGHLTMVDADE